MIQLSTYPIKRFISSDKKPFVPQTTWDAVIGLDNHLIDWNNSNGLLLFNSIKEYLQEWHDTLPEQIKTQEKWQSPDGTVFILSVSNDGQPIFTKEDDETGTESGTNN